MRNHTIKIAANDEPYYYNYIIQEGQIHYSKIHLITIQYVNHDNNNKVNKL